jgi:DNA-binding NarL/FixJ family response regulator
VAPVQDLSHVDAAGHGPAVLRIVVADDDYLVLQGIVRLIDAADDMHVVACAISEEEALEAVATQRPDVVITAVDLAPLHGHEGLRLASRLRREQPDTAVIVLAADIQVAYASRLFAEGAVGRGLLRKGRGAGRHDLVAAVREVALGGSVLDPDVIERLVARPRREHGPLGGLTAREREVLSLLADGHSNASIADVLVLTKRSVEKHVSEIFTKLAVPDDAATSRRVAVALLYLRATGALTLAERERPDEPASDEPRSLPLPG